MLSNSRFNRIAAGLGLALVALVALLLLLGQSPVRASTAAVDFKDQARHPISGTVRILCFAESDSRAPLADLNLQVNGGRPTTALPPGCNYLAALHQRQVVTSGLRSGPAYTRYTTSWAPGTTATVPASGTVTIDDAWPLTLFHVSAALAWEPGPRSSVATANSVRAGLRAASAALYDWTEGRMAIGPVAVHTGGAGWNEADLRFLPANDYRPSAFVGGIMREQRVYTAPIQLLTYGPAPVYLGRLWDGNHAYDEASGSWTQPNAYRTILHEWSHFAFFLYDEYSSIWGNSGYCICNELNGIGCGLDELDASVMALHYPGAADEFWHADFHTSAAPFCDTTWQKEVHNESDWQTLARWDAIQGFSHTVPSLAYPASLSEQQPGLASHLFGTTPGHTTFLPLLLVPGTGVPPATEPMLKVELPTAGADNTASQVYLIQETAGGITRILPQGRATGEPVGNTLGSLRLLGVDGASPGVVRAFAQRYSLPGGPAAGSFQGSQPLPASRIALPAITNPYTLQHEFALDGGRLMSVTLSLWTATPPEGTPIVQLCSLDAGVGCDPRWATAMQDAGGNWWQAELGKLAEQDELPRYLVARIRDGNGSLDLIQWLQAAGAVGPTHRDGMAPLLDGQVMVAASEPMDTAGDENLVSFMPAANSGAISGTLESNAGITHLIGQPLDVTVIMPGNGDNLPLGADRPLQNWPVQLLFYYPQDVVDRLNLNEAQLQLLHYDQTVGWTTVQQIDVNTDLNWISAAIAEDGIYAVGW